jgi:hypothetical protein
MACWISRLLYLHGCIPSIYETWQAALRLLAALLVAQCAF